MKFSILKNDRLIALSLSIIGICCIIFGIDSYQYVKEMGIILFVFSGALIVYSIVMLLSSFFNYIFIDNRKIKMYKSNKIKKSIDITDVKRLIIWQINFHGARNEYIIFDDGTFQKTDFANKKGRTRKSYTQESWIAIEYSNKRFDEIRKILQDCPIDVIKPDQY